eukprot:TRINITY_DN11293_c1_g2_i1.p1 TRINITY_DN11293_c1_g2~~TRINITY_DN11293_c1_g2_i1.p1  ORF type:complete len:695 (-),score=145.56 TRINITY_DN11293_c1_g2_i1:42-2090(-)
MALAARSPPPPSGSLVMSGHQSCAVALRRPRALFLISVTLACATTFASATAAVVTAATEVRRNAPRQQPLHRAVVRRETAAAAGQPSPRSSGRPAEAVSPSTAASSLAEVSSQTRVASTASAGARVRSFLRRVAASSGAKAKAAAAVSRAAARLQLGVPIEGLALLLPFDKPADICGDYSGAGRAGECMRGKSEWIHVGCKRGEGCAQLLSEYEGPYAMRVPCLQLPGDWSFTAWVRAHDSSRTQTVFFYGASYPGDYRFMCEVKYDVDESVVCEEAPEDVIPPAAQSLASADGGESLAEGAEAGGDMRAWAWPSEPRRSVPVADDDEAKKKKAALTQRGKKLDGSAESAGPRITTEWNHLTLTRSKLTGKLLIYWNGQLKSMLQTRMEDVPPNSEHQIYIGSLPNQVNRDLDGSVDEVSVWTRVLSAREIRSIYSQTYAFTGSAMNLVVGRLQVLLDFEDFGADPVDCSGNRFRARLDGADAGEGRTGTAKWINTGCMRGISCVELTGKSGAKSLEVPCLKLRADWSFTAWMKPTTIARMQNLFFFGAHYNESYGFHCGADYPNSKIRCEGPKNFGMVESDGDMRQVAGEWHHFCVTRKANTGIVTIYWDGTRIGAKALGRGLMPRSHDPGTYGPESFVIGDLHGKEESAFEGIVDEVSVWTRVLSPAEVVGLRGPLSPFG